MAAEGTEIKASADGQVVYIGWNWADGCGSGLDHHHRPRAGVRVVVRATCSRRRRPGSATGETVKAGTVIGFEGNTGHSTGAHLHWAVRINGVVRQPSPVRLDLDRGVAAGAETARTRFAGSSTISRRAVTDWTQFAGCWARGGSSRAETLTGGHSQSGSRPVDATQGRFHALQERAQRCGARPQRCGARPQRCGARPQRCGVPAPWMRRSGNRPLTCRVLASGTRRSSLPAGLEPGKGSACEANHNQGGPRRLAAHRDLHGVHESRRGGRPVLPGDLSRRRRSVGCEPGRDPRPRQAVSGGGEISVDVSSTTVALPPGSYIATVTAIGPGGSARSAASPAFVR